MTITPITSAPLPSRQAWRRGWVAVAAVVAARVGAWRAAAHAREVRRSLQGLSAATLRDIGLDAPPRDRHSLAHGDFLRGL